MNKPHYHINLFWSAKDDCWITDVPVLKPCSAHGAMPEAALAHIQDPIALWLETALARGLPVPAPLYRPAICAAG